MNGKVALVVDDEQHIVHVVALKLRNAGLEVLTAADGEQAYEIAVKSRPDIVITDLQMPYMNGLELCQKLRDNPATANVPALMLTARGHALSKQDLSGTNIAEVLAKPFSPREILARVEVILGEAAKRAA
jgi:DNA-binding response OmpR family regulator